MMSRRVLFLPLCALFVACSSADGAQDDTGPEEDWWQEDEDPSADDGDDGGETDDGGGGDDDNGGREAGFFGYFFETADGWGGGVETVSEECLWEVEVTGTSVDGCETCSVGIAFTTGTPVVGADDCDEELSIANWTDASYTVGFDEDSAYVLLEGEWTPFADSFFESDFLGWFLPLE